MSRTTTELRSAGSAAAYRVLIGSAMGEETAEALAKEAAGKRVALITDTGVPKALTDDLRRKLANAGIEAEVFSFPSGEGNKNQNTATELQHQLLEKRYGRDTLVIAFGGGVVGDLAGYVAATYLRGVPWANVPTTLLAMVDSAIGGKVGIDTKYGKNTIGAFWMPRVVIMDTAYLAKLPAREILNGLFEAVKTFYTSDEKSLALAEKVDPAEPARDLENLRAIVEASVRMKVGITERDPREENERKIINFGHTIGHAIELLADFKMPHGFCVAYGMLAETRLSQLLGVLPKIEADKIFASLERLGIRSADFPKFEVERIIDATKSDKKVRDGKPYYVLLERTGSVYKKDGQYAHAVDSVIVKKALESLEPISKIIA